MSNAINVTGYVSDSALTAGLTLTYTNFAGAFTGPASMMGGVDSDSHLPVPFDVGATTNNHAFGSAPTTDFYYRIWVIPERTEAKNPPLGSNLPFTVWNAYPAPSTNILTGIVATGDDGLTLDVSAGTSWDALEMKTVNLQIGVSAPLDIDATFEFDFELGSGKYEFAATRFSALDVTPEVPIKETWEWKSDVMVAWNGDEQRYKLRPGPRRMLDQDMILDSEDVIKSMKRQLSTLLNGLVQVPYYQYMSMISVAAEVGDMSLTFDQTQTDLRAGETIVVMLPSGALLAYDINTLTSTGCTLVRAVDTAIPSGSWIMPQFSSLISGQAKIQRYAVSAAKLSLSMRCDSPRDSLSRPGSAASIVQFNSKNVIDWLPQLVGTVDDSYDANVQELDTGIGVAYRYQPWEHYKTSTAYQWKIRRRANPIEMDYWRDFAQSVSGSQKSFYMQTFRSDVVPTGDAPTEGSSTLTLLGNDYSSMYWPYAMYKQLAIVTTGGVLYANVLFCTANYAGSGNDFLQLDVPFPAGYLNITRVSLLLLRRIDDDQIVLSHDWLETVIGMNLRTVDQ